MIDDIWNDIEPLVFGYENTLAKIGLPSEG